MYNPTNDKLMERTVLHSEGVVYIRCVLNDEALSTIVQVG